MKRVATGPGPLVDSSNIMGSRNLQLDRASGASDNDIMVTSSSQQQSSGKKHRLKQRFNVVKKLGKGTYGKVQLAINKETGQEVAIKTIKKTKIESEQDLVRIRREIQIMSSIEHPHIVHIYEVFENKDKIVLVMQYASGGELYEHVSQSKLLDDNEARRLFRQIATAIYYCHQNKICHRDLKLENILLDERNNAKIADFGLSNVFDSRHHLRTFCGSPLYASPEIVNGSPYTGPEVDCWSLGVLLYTLVYGAMPFDGSNFKRLVKQISDSSYFEPKQKSQASPLIRKLLTADPRQRATIIDICLDPWVNGHCGPSAMGMGLSQSQAQPQHHHSLLKVAEDMAQLTPVRFDILLALAPVSPPLDENNQQQPAPPAPPAPPASTARHDETDRLSEKMEEEQQEAHTHHTPPLEPRPPQEQHEPMKPMEPMELIEPMGPMERMEPPDAAEAARPMGPMEPMEPEEQRVITTQSAVESAPSEMSQQQQGQKRLSSSGESTLLSELRQQQHDQGDQPATVASFVVRTATRGTPLSDLNSDASLDMQTDGDDEHHGRDTNQIGDDSNSRPKRTKISSSSHQLVQSSESNHRDNRMKLETTHVLVEPIMFEPSELVTSETMIILAPSTPEPLLPAAPSEAALPPPLDAEVPMQVDQEEQPKPDIRDHQQQPQPPQASSMVPPVVAPETMATRRAIGQS